MATTKTKQPGNDQELPETARWQVKGDGVAYTTAKDIVNSKAGRRHIAAAGKVQLFKPG